MNAVLLLALLCSPVHAQFDAKAVDSVAPISADFPGARFFPEDSVEPAALPLSEESVPVLVQLRSGGMPLEYAPRAIGPLARVAHPGSVVVRGFAGAQRRHLLVLAPHAAAAEQIKAELDSRSYEVATLREMLRDAAAAYGPADRAQDFDRRVFDQAAPLAPASAVPVFDEAGLQDEMRHLDQHNSMRSHAKVLGRLIARTSPNPRKEYSRGTLSHAVVGLERGIDSLLAAVELMGPEAEDRPDVQAANRWIARGYLALQAFGADPARLAALWPRVRHAVWTEAANSSKYADHLFIGWLRSLETRPQGPVVESSPQDRHAWSLLGVVEGPHALQMTTRLALALRDLPIPHDVIDAVLSNLSLDSSLMAEHPAFNVERYVSAGRLLLHRLPEYLSGPASRSLPRHERAFRDSARTVVLASSGR